MERKLLFPIEIRCSYWMEGQWIGLKQAEDGNMVESPLDGKISVVFQKREYGLDYEMEADVPFETQIRLEVSMKGTEKAFHVIPCNIYGDNNIDRVKPGEFISLTDKHPETRFCAPFWELRADRAAIPASMMSLKGHTIGISVRPYAEGEKVHNGLIAALPNTVGAVLGYQNLPCTFVDKGHAEPSSAEFVRRGKCRGSIYLIEEDRMSMHRIVQREYELLHSRAVYVKSYEEAVRSIIDACVNLNWNEQWQAYTDMSCCPPERMELKAWRPVYEIGWTGIAELAGPFVMAEKLLGISSEEFGKAKDGYALFDQIADSFCEESGLLNDLVAPIDESGSLVDGWWVYYFIEKGQHCAYTVGKAVYEMLKICSFLKDRGEEPPQKWLAVSKKVLDTMLRLQREDGNYGYTYSHTEKKVTDWDGFAGCWFVPAFVYAYRLTKQEVYLDSAKKAERYYASSVYDLNCYATPMDTWRAVDEEGNLAFVRGARLLHETCGEEIYLKDLEAGAMYEYLWRYGYATRPENEPLKNGWNACGGSVTSISNPHIHPMGVLIDSDLRYLARMTGNSYHQMRADDGTAWLMQNLELYPEKALYGRYGMMSERFCPSDGLVTERFSDGRPYSSWFTFNLWATANVMEAILDILAEETR